MNILITAGGTSERIDDVRKITNTATGRLGAHIAEEFLKYENSRLTYIHGTGAVVPVNERINAIEICSVEELEKTVERLLNQEKFDAVIHSMAVSDYRVKSVSSVQETASSIAWNITGNKGTDLNGIISGTFLQKSNDFINNKISSDCDNLIIVLEKTPKIIGMFKKIQPLSLLVGFKLLSGSDTETLLEAGYSLLLRNQCDFVFANDAKNVSHDRHSGILINPDRSYIEISSKHEIAKAIAANIVKEQRKKERPD